MLKCTALKIILPFALLSIPGFCSPHSSVNPVFTWSVRCLSEQHVVTNGVVYFSLSTRQRTACARPFFETVPQHKPVPESRLTNISWSPAGSGHDAVLLHFRQAKVRDHDFGVVFGRKVKKVFRL